MKNFVVYNSAGEILRTGRCQDADFASQAGEGESVIEGTADDTTQHIIDGVVSSKAQAYEVEGLVRSKRDQMLMGTDWTQAGDSPLTDERQVQYRAYRQALRDITSHANWPNLNDTDWPTLET